MDSIDLELQIQTLSEGKSKEETYTIRKLMNKIYMNSFYKPCASKYFYFYKNSN